MNKKIMAIIYSEKGNFLLLRTNPEWMGCDVWFIVTGSIEKGESEEDAVRREIKEETNLEIIKIKPTDYTCVYECPKNSGKRHKERAFLVKVKEATPKLSGEHTEFKWLSKYDFIRKVDWWGGKARLREVLSDVEGDVDRDKRISLSRRGKDE
jgi:ADP-ribose pyrophosphatase YjhB (NUDIX family)